MEARISIIMGSATDLPIIEKAATTLNDFEIPFEMHALSAHRTPHEVEEYARNAATRGIEVIIAAAGMSAALPGVIAANTTIPVIGVPIKGQTLDGLDALYSIVQMPPGIPVATVGINAALNAALLALQILSIKDTYIQQKLIRYKENQKDKTIQANNRLKEITCEYKTN
jgi:5-(carboxyamino)imidazole ribonucleotide mutase